MFEQLAEQIKRAQKKMSVVGKTVVSPRGAGGLGSLKGQIVRQK